MSIRTTAESVGNIIEVDQTISLDPFIETASALVDDIAEDSAAPSASRLELIERWLAAHFYTVRDPRPSAEKAGPVSVNHQTAVDLNLATSHYGQQAMMLDTTGYLRSISKGTRKRVKVFWLGNEDDNGLVDDVTS